MISIAVGLHFLLLSVLVDVSTDSMIPSLFTSCDTSDDFDCYYTYSLFHVRLLIDIIPALANLVYYLSLIFFVADNTRQCCSDFNG